MKIRAPNAAFVVVVDKETKVPAGRSTIYRKCACGETAHDLRAPVGGERWSYASRNCGARYWVKRGGEVSK